MKQQAKDRQQLLEILYRHREAHASQLPQYQWLTVSELKNAVGEIDFALSVLVDLQWVEQSGFKVRITGQGVLACEAAQV